MPPKISIVLPVYNVEPYLRQCLDSVVNQTMRELQIICVNDGSTDGSSVILEEYASEDSRIKIIHQENQGSGSARNAAYPYIRGRYTYFVDPDDWIELDLCQHCWDKAEAAEANMVVMRCIVHNPEPKCSPPFNPTFLDIRQTPEEKYDAFGYGAAPWLRFWRSDFLLSNRIRFPEGKRPFNDMLPAWKGLVLADRIAILDRPLYHYRARPGSYQQTIDEKHFFIVSAMVETEKMLHETGCYESYRNAFILQKLKLWFSCYHSVPKSLIPRFAVLIRNALTEDDREFYRTASRKILHITVRSFYQMIDGGSLESMKYYGIIHLRSIVQIPERLFRHHVIKPIKKILKAA